jgi:hypothetical protein
MAEQMTIIIIFDQWRNRWNVEKENLEERGGKEIKD